MEISKFVNQISDKSYRFIYLFILSFFLVDIKMESGSSKASQILSFESKSFEQDSESIRSKLEI